MAGKRQERARPRRCRRADPDPRGAGRRPHGLVRRRHGRRRSQSTEDNAAAATERQRDGIRASIEVIPAEPVDLTRDVARLTLHDLAVPDEQVLDVGQDRVRDLAAALFAAEAAGVARWCQRAGLEYAKVREQFGAAHRLVPGDQAQVRAAVRPQPSSSRPRPGTPPSPTRQDPGSSRWPRAAAAIALPAATDLGLET